MRPTLAPPRPNCLDDAVVLRIAIVGPGRVGQALGLGVVRGGAQLLGFLGRQPDRSAAACTFAGAGRPLEPAELRSAHLVLFCTGDPELATAIAALAPFARPCSVWLHTSGRFDLQPFAGVPGIRRAALHPVLPFPDAARGAALLAGAPAVLQAEPNARRLTQGLARRLGMTPIWRDGGSPVLYHAACALAANGLTALQASVDAVFAAAGGLSAADRLRLAQSLARAALDACADRGPAAALTGPVRRGDAATVAAHLDVLREQAPGQLATYVATMRTSLELAVAQGLPPPAAAALRGLLGPGGT